MEAEGFDSSQGRLLYSSPLDILVRRASSRRQAAKQRTKTASNQASAGIIVPPALQPGYAHYAQPTVDVEAVSPSRQATDQHVPGSPLLHSNFRSSTATNATNITALHVGQGSKSFLSLVDGCEPDEVCHEDDDYYGHRAQPYLHYNLNNSYSSFATTPSASTQLESQPDSWLQATRPRQSPILNHTNSEDLMCPPPSVVPTVVISSSPDGGLRLSGPMRQPVVSQNGSPRLNFSRPGRPPILSSEEQKRQVLERNAGRPNSPRTNPSLATLSPITPVTGVHPDGLHVLSHLSSSELPSTLATSSYLHPDGAHSSPSLISPGHVHLPSHPPSLRAGSPLSLYSNSYSFYQLDRTTPSPTSQSPGSTPDNISPATSRPVSAEPQTPEAYLKLGIRYHEANQLKDSALYFEKSAKEQGGCGVGMLMWGLAQRHGWGCEKNEKSGFRWLSKAAESAVQDLEKAKKGLDVRGIKEELVLAIYEVGQCFFHGWGVAKDQKMAVNYYRVAAKLGDADAQQDLAFCLANGKGCKKDKKEAAKWYRAAVAQGVSDVGMAWIYKDKYRE